VITISQPKGVCTALNAKLIQPTQAVECSNVRLVEGGWQPWKAPVKVADFRRAAPIQSIYLYGPNETTDWWEWNVPVNVAPISRYANKAVVYTGDGVPKLTNGVLAAGAGPRPNVSYDLGLSFPVAAPTTSVSGTPAVGEQDFEVFVVFTYVDSEGREGRPSPPSGVVIATSSQSVNVAGMSIPAGNNSYTAKRIYATQGSSTTGFFLRGEVPAGQSNFVFTAAKVDSGQGPGDLLETLNLFSAPSDGKSVVYMPNEFLAMISGDSIVFSEVGLLHGFPPDYAIKCPFKPVALAVFGNTLVVGTEGRQYLYQGIEPGQMQEIKGDRVFACVSARSMVDADGAAIGYVANEGFVLVTQNGSVLLTSPYFTKRQWQELNPASMHGVFWDGYFVMFFDAGLNKRALVIPVNGSEPFYLSLWASAAFVKEATNQLYLAMVDGIYRFDSGAALAWSWTSKVFALETMKSFSVLQVRCDGPIAVTAYADGRQQWVRTCTNDEIVTVGDGYLSHQWQFKLESSFAMQSFAIAENYRELLAV
jgi:hypothetical protein